MSNCLDTSLCQRTYNVFIYGGVYTETNTHTIQTKNLSFDF